jgi:hypothetical protein
MGVGHPGKLLEEMCGKLDDGAVLDEDALIAAELPLAVFQVGGVGAWAGNAPGDQVLEEPVDKGLERIAHA